MGTRLQRTNLDPLNHIRVHQYMHLLRNSYQFKKLGGRHSTEEAFTLPTWLSWVQIISPLVKSNPSFSENLLFYLFGVSALRVRI